MNPRQEAERQLAMWTIYQNPRDAPGQFVVRRLVVQSGGSIVHDRIAQYAKSLAAARSLVPPGLVPIPRHEKDDPTIVEVWM